MQKDALQRRQKRSKFLSVRWAQSNYTFVVIAKRDLLQRKSALLSEQTIRVLLLSEQTQDKIEIRSRCPTCNSQVLMIVSKETRDALDLNGKRHFCEPEDRRRHEEDCVIRLTKLVDDC